MTIWMTLSETSGETTEQKLCVTIHVMASKTKSKKTETQSSNKMPVFELHQQLNTVHVTEIHL